MLDIFDGKLEKLRLQKLLFLFTQRQVKAEYDFIPYKFGCYSYSLNADLTAMVRKNILHDNSSIGIVKMDKGIYIKTLKEADKKILIDIKKLYGSLDGVGLMRHTYINYPYFAIYSLKASEILTKEEFGRIDHIRPQNDNTVLFTIGYEGVSLEAYLNKLIKYNVQVLVDVRKNPLSMKYGFSKSLLKKFCENIGIQYVHIPDVGIDSNQRQELNTQKDYDALFEVYKSENLTSTINTQAIILDILKVNKRIALTCFEANICQCHRKPLAEAIASLPGFDFDLKHI